jgi:hypothetical protein
VGLERQGGQADQDAPSHDHPMHGQQGLEVVGMGGQMLAEALHLPATLLQEGHQGWFAGCLR